MRMRRKPWVRKELAECEFFVDNPCENLGKWENKFTKKQPIELELGCGKGTFIAKLAVKNPDKNFLAIDVKSEVLGIAKRNIEAEYLKENKKVDNVLITAYEIGLIENILNEKDVIDRIYINFCNPWPKPRHNKRRLTYTTYLEKYKVFLKPGGEIWFKTDEDDLYRATKKYLEQAGFKIIKTTEDLHSEKNIDNIVTDLIKASVVNTPLFFQLPQNVSAMHISAEAMQIVIITVFLDFVLFIYLVGIIILP